MRRLLAIFGIAGVLGCGGDGQDPTSPEHPFSVTISGGGSAVGHFVTINSTQYYQCGYTFRATTAGGGSLDDAPWTDGSIDYRLTANGATSSQFIYNSDMQDWFGVDRLRPGATATATRSLAWSGPFTATVTFRYTIYRYPSIIGEGHSDVIPVSCT